MKTTISAGAALLLTTTAAFAGGIDRSGQPVGLIFADGNRVELSFGIVSPDVSGTFTVPAGPAAGLELSSGSVAPRYTQIGGGFRYQYTDTFAAALIFDQPFGAEVDYAEPGYPLFGTYAKVESVGVTVLGQYQINENVSVHGGLRAVQTSGIYSPDSSVPAPSSYESEYSEDVGYGYVIGAAYERPEIALRVALTYSSAIDYDLDGTAGDLDARTPQSVNLDFQTGVAADTLVFGSIRWAEWSEGYLDDSLAGPLVDWDDSVTYNIGVGRRFSDQLSGSVSIGYEASSGDAASNLSPTDGYISVSVGAKYQVNETTDISGGIRYVKLGDATTEGLGSDFSDNSAIAVGFSIGYSF